MAYPLIFPALRRNARPALDTIAMIVSLCQSHAYTTPTVRKPHPHHIVVARRPELSLACQTTQMMSGQTYGTRETRLRPDMTQYLNGQPV